MRQHIASFVSTCLALLAMAAEFWWVRSYWVVDQTEFAPLGDIQPSLCSASGRLALSLRRIAYFDQKGTPIQIPPGNQRGWSFQIDHLSQPDSLSFAMWDGRSIAAHGFGFLSETKHGRYGDPGDLQGDYEDRRKLIGFPN